MKEKWTLADIEALPSGEHNYFERKSGELYEKSAFREALGKAISAFANSGGGHLLLGVRDDGSIDGVQRKRKNTETKDFIEQIVPNCVDYPLSEFRVHAVQIDDTSTGTEEKVVIVIDVGDSPHAPHQARHNGVYYYRPGGRSEPAPHFYLEALRNRMVHPSFEIKLDGLNYLHARRHKQGVFLLLNVGFEVTNVGRVIAQHWMMAFDCKNPSMKESGTFRVNSFPEGTLKLNRKLILEPHPLLPGMSGKAYAFFCLNFEMQETDDPSIMKVLERFLRDKNDITYSCICENSKSTEVLLDIEHLRDWIKFDNVYWALPENSDKAKLYGGHGVYCVNLMYDSRESGDYIEFTFDLLNKSGPNYSGAYGCLNLLTQDGSVNYSAQINIDHLPKGSSRRMTVAVERKYLRNSNDYAFIFLCDDSFNKRD